MGVNTFFEAIVISFVFFDVQHLVVAASTKNQRSICKHFHFNLFCFLLLNVKMEQFSRNLWIHNNDPDLLVINAYKPPVSIRYFLFDDTIHRDLNIRENLWKNWN